jgi:drug/metabolite transporter (DMT)-like permease
MDQTQVPTAKPPFIITQLIISNLLLAFGPWLVRMADTGPIAAGFWRIALAIPVLFVLAKLLKDPVRMPPRGLMWVLIAAGFIFAADLISWHLGIRMTKLANANLLGNSTAFLLPIWVFISTRILPNWQQGVALALAGVGTAIMMGRSFELSTDSLIGDILCFMAGAFYTVFLVMMTRVRDQITPLPMLAIISVTSAPFFFMAALGAGEDMWPQNWGPLILLALGSQVIGQVLMLRTINHVSALLFGLLLLSQPIIGTIIGWFAYNEVLTKADWIGGALIALALLMVREPEKAKRTAP